MKILPLILSILITTSSLLAEDVEKITITNKTPYNLFLDLDTKPTKTGQMLIMQNGNNNTNHKFNLEDTAIAYNIGFSGNPKTDSYGTPTQIYQQNDGTHWSDLKDGLLPYEDLPNNGISNAELKDKIFNPDLFFKYEPNTKTLKITIQEYK